MSSTLQSTAEELFTIVDQLAEVSDQAKSLRKQKKDLELGLLEGMIAQNINEIEIGGRRITLSTNLKLEK